MTAESDLLHRVLDALFREDHLGLASRGSLYDGVVPGFDLTWWRAGDVLIPVVADGFLADYRVAAPLLVVLGAEPVVVRGLDEALRVLAPVGDRAAADGWADFTAECAQTLMALRLEPGPLTGARTGFGGLLRYEARAARRGHPVYPTGQCRWGWSEREIRRYAPEFQPRFALHWALVPREQLRLSAELERDGFPSWWPADGDHVAVPVHPVTAERGEVSTVDGMRVEVTPTLSTRTVAVLAEPWTQLKLPLGTATLGRRNRRGIKPGTLADGAAVQELLGMVLEREPALRQRILLADESHWLDSPDEMLAVLIRRYPAELDGDTLAPLADPDLVAHLASGDLVGWFDRYLTVLLDWHLALWLRYGIALESHQQNITVAQGPTGIRLVYKDNDGARIDCARLSAALGVRVTRESFVDGRIAVADPAELADLFSTITLHLCAAALIVANTELRGDLFALLRCRIEEAAARWGTDPAALRLLRSRVLDADRLPVKAMVTAGTLLPKDRLGCADINKHYRYSGPNYLRTASQRRS
jgi:siderophore synthetase component